MKQVSQTKVQLDAKKLVHLRAKRKWTQKQAAKKARVSLPTYGNAERGMTVQAAKAGKIAEAYEVDLSELEARSA